MPWKEQSIMDAREDFCRLALTDGVTMRELCRRFGISPTTGYRWRARYEDEGARGLADRSRRPHRSPGMTREAVVGQVVQIREAHPAWGGRKIRAVLLRTGAAAPSASTITAILAREGLLDPAVSEHRTRPTRFEAPAPNALWQMDFKGHVPLGGGGRCHPLTVLDDYSRFALAIRALGNEQTDGVKATLRQLFERYGLPNRILCDNGPPWGSPSRTMTALDVWLLHLDVVPIHGRPRHPQTQGKDERFHRTLKAEVLQRTCDATLAAAQHRFDGWRQVYNHERPHEALGLVAPITRYQPSPRSYPRHLPVIEYPERALVRRVTTRGVIKLWGRSVYVGEGFCGYPLAVCPTAEDGQYTIYFRHYAIAQVDRRTITGGGGACGAPMAYR